MGRIRVSGILSRGRRGLFLTTTDEVVWIIESEEPECEFVGSAVIVEGVVAGRDRLRAETGLDRSDRSHSYQAARLPAFLMSITFPPLR